MSAPTRVISDTSLQILLQAGNSIELASGFRTVSMQTISSYASDETIDVPDILNSSQTLQFCGMSKDVSDQLYDKWMSDQNSLSPGDLGHGQPIIKLAQYYVQEMGKKFNAYSESDDWSLALQHQGISSTTQARILDPHFKHLRLACSAREWALDTLNLSWEFLDGLDSRVKRMKKENDLRAPSPDPSIKPKAAIKPSSSLISALHGGSSSPLLASEVEPPKQLPGKTIFYKGGGWDRLVSIFNPDGSLDLNEDLISDPPTDFHPTNLNLYFTKQFDVAVEYAGFAGRRVPAQTPTIMTVAVPQSIMSSAVQVFGSDWKDLVWHSRNKRATMKAGGILPPHLSHYGQAGMLIGNICYQCTDQVAKLKNPDELSVLKTKNGDKGSQIMLHGPEMFETFSKECRGFVWVAPLASLTKAKYFPPPA